MTVRTRLTLQITTVTLLALLCIAGSCWAFLAASPHGVHVRGSHSRSG